MNAHFSQNTRGFNLGMVSCVFACLSIILLVSSCVGNGYAHALADALMNTLSKPDQLHYASPRQVPTFPWNRYIAAKDLGWISMILGVLTLLVAIVSGQISVSRARKAGNRRARRLGIIGLVGGYGCIILAGVSGWLAFQTLFDFFGWGLTM
jgi:hypothetical protein